MGGVIVDASFEWGVAVSERGIAVYEEVVSCTAPSNKEELTRETCCQGHVACHQTYRLEYWTLQPGLDNYMTKLMHSVLMV